MPKERNWKKVWEKLEGIEKRITTDDDYYSRVVTKLNKEIRGLSTEWTIYENEYRKYLAKRDRLQRFLWWLCRKITFRSTELTKKDRIKRIAKKMARIFYEGGH